MRSSIAFSRVPGLLAALFIALAPRGPANAADTRESAVEVVYLNPDSYTDFGDGYATPDSRRNALFDEIRRHLQRAVPARVPEGSHLHIAVTDIDMAGTFEPPRGPNYNRVRIMRDVYPPRIKLEFVLTAADGAALKQGRRDLTDLNYLTNVDYRGQILRHEKKLLDDWLAREFSPSEPH